MKKTLVKFLSVALAVIMVVGFVPLINPVQTVQSSAATYPKAKTKEWYYASGTTFIKSMCAGYDGNKLSTVISQMKEAGYTNVKNLSGGDMDTAAAISKADYTTIGYNTTTDPTAAITGCLFSVTRDGSSHSGTITTNPYNYAGIRVNATFKQVNGANSSGEPSYRDGDCDLNRNGSGAAWCYFYVTRTYDFGPAVTDVRIESSIDTLKNNGYTLTYSVQAPTTPADSTYGKGNKRYVGFKSSCTEIDSSALRTAAEKASNVVNSENYTAASRNDVKTYFDQAVNVINDLADGYTTTTQTTINSITNNLNSKLNALQTTVTLNANGGSGGGTDTVTVGLNTSYNYTTGKTATKTGYTFKGWSSSSSATSGSTTLNACFNLTYYAAWSPITYTVTYNGNGKTDGTTANSTHTYNTEKALTANGYTRKYTVTYNYNGSGAANTSDIATYAFDGWNTAANGSGTSYTNEQKVINLSDTQGANINLYAKWKSASVTLPTPTRKGYTFGGWYKESGCTNFVGNGGASYTPTDAITLYAKWTVNKYTITYKADDMTTVLKTETLDYGATPTPPAIPAKAPDANFHYAGEWNTNDIGPVTEDATYYVVYNMVQHTGGTATCTSKKQCTACGYAYGDTLAHSYTVLQKDGTNHWYKCANCTATNGTEAHKGGTATCTAKAVCSVCSTAYGDMLEHEYTVLQKDETNHWYKCANCTATTGTEAHKGGTATCTAKAVCSVCSTAYGDMLEHSYTVLQKDETNHWYKCANCTATNGTEAHKGGTATCTAKAVCSVCSTAYGDMLEHEYTVLQKDETNHWYKCANCSATTGTEAHKGGTATCVDKKVCTVCDTAYGETFAHSYTGAIKNNENGTHSYKCVNGCNNYGGTVDCTNISSDITTNSTCEVKGITTYTCEDCGYTYTEQNVALAPHTYGAWVKDADADTHTKTCSVCSKANDGHTVTENCAGGEADCSNLAVCDKCGEEYGTYGAHKLTKVDAVTPTCLTPGHIEYYHCSVCSKNFSDATAAAELTNLIAAHTPGVKVIENDVKSTCKELGHYDEVVYCTECPTELSRETKNYTEYAAHTFGEMIEEQAATCKAAGIKAHKVCSVCEKNFDAEGNVIADLTITIDSDNHTNVTHIENAKTQSCTEEGYTGDTVCECGATLVEGEVIEMDAHTFTEYVDVKTEATCMANRVDTFKCANCDATTDKEIADSKDADNHTNVTHIENAKTQSCTEEGYTGDTVCECGEKLVTGSVIPMGEHNFEEFVANKTAATCMANRVDTFKCTGCTTTKDIEIADSKDADNHTNVTHIENAKTQSCTEEGYTGDTVCECGVTLVEGEVITKDAHEFGEWTTVTGSTCTVKGSEKRECANCDEVETRELAFAAHTETTVNAKTATCKEDGYTGDKVCSVCDTTLETGTVITKLAHEFGEWTTVTASTCTVKGSEKRECANCDTVETRELALASHTETTVNAKTATCKEDGYTGDKVCSVCDTTLETGTVITKLAHQFGAWTTVTEATPEADGVEKRVCSVCSAEETRPVKYEEPAQGERTVKFINIKRMHYILDLNGSEYMIFNSSSVNIAANKPLTFRVHLNSNFGYEDVIVYVNGVELAANEDGSYTIPAGDSLAVVTVTGAVDEKDDDGNTTGKISFWEMLINFFKKLVSMLSGFFGGKSAN